MSDVRSDLGDGRVIERQWQCCWRAMGIDNPAHGQRQEMRRAFYAGAAAILLHLASIAELSEEQIEGRIDELEAECRRFTADIRSGRA